MGKRGIDNRRDSGTEVIALLLSLCRTIQQQYVKKERKKEKEMCQTSFLPFCLPFNINIKTTSVSLSVHIQLCKYVDVLNEPQAECPA